MARRLTTRRAERAERNEASINVQSTANKQKRSKKKEVCRFLRTKTSFNSNCRRERSAASSDANGVVMTEEGEDAPDWVIATQSQLGAIIRRPKLTTALLKKPPFRFLHDIVSEVCCSDESVSRHTE